jgi:hypothetical protein
MVLPFQVKSRALRQPGSNGVIARPIGKTPENRRAKLGDGIAFRRQPVETPAPKRESHHAAFLNQRHEMARVQIICLGLEGCPNRTSGNEGVPLQLHRLMESRPRPERPAPSLLQMSSHYPEGRVATGAVSSRYHTEFLTT